MLDHCHLRSSASYRILSFSCSFPLICTLARFPARSEKELGYEIWDINTGLPAARDTIANGTRSGAVVQRDKELRGAETEAAPAQTAKAEVVQHKKDQEFEIFDLLNPRLSDLWALTGACRTRP